MNDTKYIGLDVHQATISAAVLDAAGKLLMESTFETKAAMGRPPLSESQHRSRAALIGA